MSSIKVVLAMPSYGHLIPEANTSVLNACFKAARHGVDWVATANADRESWSAARSLASDGARADPSVDGVLWVDSDMLIPQDAFARLILSGKDLITGIYFKRKAPYWPNVFKWDERRQGFVVMLDWPKDKIAPIGGFGFGCCYTSTRLLRALPESPFKFAEFSEDLGFCHKADEAGFKPHVDTGVICKHHRGNKWADEELFTRFRSILASSSERGEDNGGFFSLQEEDVRGVHQVQAGPA